MTSPDPSTTARLDMAGTAGNRRNDPTLRRATAAVYAVFIVNGFAFATWASRIPAVRDELGLSTGALGRLLLCLALGSVVALPLSGPLVGRIGEARTITALSIVEAVGMAIVALGYTHSVWFVAVGLFLMGYGSSTWDVAMNVQGAAVERHLGYAIMPRFHAGFSLGTVAAAGIGSLLIALHVDVSVHLAACAVLIVALTPATTRAFLPHEQEPTADIDGRQPPRSALAAWREPRTLLIGVLVLCMAFIEGTGNDWLAVSTIDGYHTSAVLGTIAFAIFLAAMTVGRWFGPGLIDRYGRVPVLRLTALTSLIGLLMVVFGQVYAVAAVGAVLWGVGASLGFPVGMSAAADDPTYAAGRVSVAASIGYLAFLGGPPTIGFLGDHVGALRALLLAAGLLVIAVLVCGATRPLPGTEAADAEAADAGPAHADRE